MASIEGTLTSTVGVQQTLSSFTAGEKASWILYLDASNMIQGDAVEITLSTQVTASGPLLTVLFDGFTFDDLGVDTTLVSIPIVVENGYGFSVAFEQTTGSSKDYSWRLADVPINS